MKELYISGNDKEVKEILDLVRPRIGKDKINVIDLSPKVCPNKECSCGGEFEIICCDCGERGIDNPNKR